jgi:hypothetical protein
MKEITPKELQKLNNKSFKNTQKIFRRRLREIAAGGENKAKYNENDYCAGDDIAGWLTSLGFTVKRVGPSGWHEITWPEIKREELGIWNFDLISYDHVCSVCGKHSEYATDFCCNCGKKMMNDKE